MIDSNYKINFSYNLQSNLPNQIISGKMIPSELVSKMISHLGPESLATAACINKGFNETSIFIAKNNEFKKMKELVDFVNENVSDKECKIRFEEIFCKDIGEISGSINLPDVKLFSNNLIEKIMNVFIDLSEDELNRLIYLSTDERVSRVFFLTKINKKLKDLEEKSENSSSYDLIEICGDLTRNGYTVRAKIVARTISVSSFKVMAYESICTELLNKENIDEAVTMAYETRFSCDLIFNICSHLLEQGNVEKVKELANTSPSEEIKSNATSQICKYLAEKEKVDEAIELTNTLDKDAEKSDALFEIVCVLSKTGNFDKAIEVANTIPVEEEKSKAISRISADKEEGNY